VDAQSTGLLAVLEVRVRVDVAVPPSVFRQIGVEARFTRRVNRIVDRPQHFEFVRVHHFFSYFWIFLAISHHKGHRPNCARNSEANSV